MIICTVTSANNLHRAKVMARSAKIHHPEVKVIVCLLEEELHPAASDHYFDELVLAKHLDIANFYSFIYEHNVFEAACALKVFTLKYALNQHPGERKFIYLDTDMKLFSPMDELLVKLDKYSIIITPHQLEMAWNTISYVFYGVYNAGFLAVSRSDEAERFLDWWAERMYHFCFYDNRYFVDQTWLNLVPALFNAYIYRNPGYNMAAWNLHEKNRLITSSNLGSYFFDDQPLCLFHFTCLNGFLQSRMEESIPDQQNSIYSLLENYLTELEEMGRSELINVPWSYGKR